MVKRDVDEHSLQLPTMNGNPMYWIDSTRYLSVGVALLLVAILPARAQTRNWGVDVSHYQGGTGISQASWNQMFAEGKRFVFIKATEGLTGPDDAAMANNVARATAAGLLVGVYHYPHPENRPTPSGAVQEADHFLNYAGSAIGPGRLRPALDLQGSAANLGTTALTDWVIAFANEIIAQRGPNAAPIIYSQQYFVNVKLDSRLADYDLWLQTTGTGADPATADPPAAGYPTATGVFNNWSFWQYTTSGSAGGISSLDLDVCHSEFKPIESFVIPVPGTLALSISHTPTNTLVISWPLNSLGYWLQENSNPASTDWVNTAATSIVACGQRQAVVPLANGSCFYRLVCAP
jgi:GH25 family lysozyme M1 (1,4-beta-N-acetylmuramidase)